MPRILIVDANEIDRCSLRELLWLHGYKVDEAANGEEALEKACLTLPDLVISDLLMPVMGGYTLLQHWKSDRILQSVSFVVYTSIYTQAKDEQQVLASGADAFIVKAANHEILLAQIRALLAHYDHQTLLNTSPDELVCKLEEKMTQLMLANEMLKQDAVERQQAEEKYQQLAERLSLATKNAGIGIWTWDVVNDKSVWDDQMYRLYGIREEDHEGNYEAWIKCVDTQQIEKNNSLIQAALLGEQEYVTEFPICWPDNSVRYIAASAKVMRSAEGQPLRMVGINYDVTSRKQAEDLLQQAKDKAEKTATELSSYLEAIGQLALVVVSDLSGRIIKVNNKFCEVTGYSESELLGEECAVINIAVCPEDFFTQMWATVTRGNIWHGEVCHQNKQGGLYWVDMIVVPVKDNAGEISGYISVRVDITEHKQTEMDLKERLKETSCLYAIRHDMLLPLLTEDFCNRIISHIIPAMQFPEVTAVAIQFAGLQFTSKNYQKNLSHGLHAKITVNNKVCGELDVFYTDDSKPFLIPEETNLINAIASDLQLWLERKQIEEARKKSEALVWQQANFDALTSLPNRRMFSDRLEQEIKTFKRTKLPFALMVFDLDHFKQVNDTYGHGSGDVLLKDAAVRLHGCVREVDLVARLGGDEFVVIVAGLDNLQIVERVAQKILHKLAEPFHLGNEVAYISTSIGIAFYPENGSNADMLLGNADQAMYASKNQGRNCFSYFTASMQQSAQARWRLTEDLSSALLNNEFQLYYQPIVELATGLIHKAEALIRWYHPAHGMINPAEFIPIAEDSGMIIKIGDWVFRQAVMQVKKWRLDYQPDFQISINVSPIQFHNQNYDLETWFDYLQQQGLSGQSIAVEITEGLLLDTNENVIDQLFMLRDAGVQVSIDDFGTGYSALSYLKKFHIDYLKIDQSFIQNLTIDSDNMALSEAIIVMAHKLGLKVIAEGVETIEQRDLLIAAGCDYAQGYLFAKPLSAEDFQDFLQ